jgi:hypothetical protein
MNPATQFNLHPDAESLNGIIEGELPEADRARVLDHLAACSRCREIVYLAQDAADAPVPPVAAKTRGSSEAHAGSWFSFWRLGWSGLGWSGLGWTGAAACTLVLAIAVFVQVRRAAQSDQVAKSGSAASPLAGAASTSPPAIVAPKEKAPAIAAPQAASSPSVFRGRATQLDSPTAARMKAAPVASASSSALAPAQALTGADAISQAKSPAAAPRLAARNATAAHGGPNAQQMNNQSQMQNSDKAQNSGQNSGLISQQQVSNLPSPASTAPPAEKPISPAAATQTVEVSAAAAPLETEAVTDAQVVTIAPGAGGKASAGGIASFETNPGLPRLPSGLPAVSNAAAGHTQLAIDAAGALFFSHDKGKKWQPVESQWTGRAVAVRLAQASPGTGAGVAGGLKDDALAGKKKSAGFALFEIVNTEGAVWTSADGKTWIPK